MIFFDGLPLESAAPVKIVDVLVSPIKYEPTARQRPVTFGSDFVRLTGGSRTIAITFALLTMNKDARQEQLLAISRWARSEKPKRLILPHDESRFIECICTSLPEPSLRQWWESKLRIVFTTFDNPFFTDVEEKGIPCGTQFSAIGSAVPIMRIERQLTSAATNQTYSNGRESMTFSTIPAGKLVIDLNRQTATVNGTSIMQYFTFGSRFLIPRQGIQTITGNGSVYWRERWD